MSLLPAPSAATSAPAHLCMPGARGPRVLVTGAAGYIGSTVVRELLSSGYQVVAVDRMYFGEAALSSLLSHPGLCVLRMDVRHLAAHHLYGCHAVLDLAAISNDPAAELDPRWTEEVNHLARVRLARLAREAAVPRYVLVSSCSVYGRAGTAEVDERSAVDPITEYSRAGVKAEQGILALSGDGFAPTALRLGTVYGASYRMRFDIVVNTMTLSAFRQGRLALHGGGRQWRPHVHVKDVAGAIIATLRAPDHSVRGEVFNIGQINLQIRDIARTVRNVYAEHMGLQVDVQADGDSTDMCNYRVLFSKAEHQLGFKARASLEEAIATLGHRLAAGSMVDSPQTYTTAWYKHLLERSSLSLASAALAEP